LENRRSTCLRLSIIPLCFSGWVRIASGVRRGRFIMAKLIYSTITSLDGYVADEQGNFDWAAPDEEVHAFVNYLERPIGTHLYGRRMYEVMRYWESAHAVTDRPPVEQDYAQIWRSTDKIVYSKTLDTICGARTRIERDFDAEAVRRLKEGARQTRHRRGRSRPRRPGARGRAGRRVPSVPHAHRGGRRQTVPPQRCPPGARTAGRTPFRRRRGLPPVPDQDVSRRRRRTDHLGTSAAYATRTKAS
jgi:hypothetical protein